MPGTTKVNIKLCENVSSIGAQAPINLFGYEIEDMTIQVTLTGTGAVTATVQVEVSNDGIGWLYDSVSTLNLSGTNVASLAFASIYQWQMVRVNLISITGTNAKISSTLAG